MRQERGREGDVFGRIQEDAVRSLFRGNAGTTNLHIDRKVLKKGAKITAGLKKIQVNQDSVMVFADDAPRLNWGHPCRYLIYDANDGGLRQEVAAEFPPYLTKTPETFKPFHEPVRLDLYPRYWYVKPWLYCPWRLRRGNRYAVLYAGAANNRHTNDLEFLYRTLRHLYGFPAANIYVLNYDGTLNYSGGPQPVTAWPGDSTAYQMPVNGQGTKAAFEGVIDTLKTKLKKDDFLLIHTNNHGGYDGPGKANLVTYSGPWYYANDFANKIGELPAYSCLMVMMEQCHAGGFNAPILAKTTASMTSVASACLEPNNSIGGADFDPFARDWIAAMAGHTPYGGALAFGPDSDGDGKIEADEAFNYANAVHDPYDTPVYSESSSAGGDCSLAQRYVWWWWWCPLIYEILYPIYIKLPIPEFYDKLHRVVGPALEKIAHELDEKGHAMRPDVEARVKAIVSSAF